MKNETEKWVDEVIGSLDGLKPWDVPASMFKDVMNKVESESAKVSKRIVPMRQVWLAAASIVILLLLNLFTIFSINHSSKSSTNDVQQLIESYGLEAENGIYSDN